MIPHVLGIESMLVVVNIHDIVLDTAAHNKESLSNDSRYAVKKVGEMSN